MQDVFPDAPYHQNHGTVTSAVAGSTHRWTKKYSFFFSCVFYTIAHVERDIL